MPEQTTPNLDDAIRDNASGPAKASVDGQSIEQHGLADQIAADRYLGPDQITTSLSRGFFGNDGVNGIEHDRYGNPTHHHVLKCHPGDTSVFLGLGDE